MGRLKTFDEHCKDIVIEKKNFPSQIENLERDAVRRCLNAVVVKLNAMDEEKGLSLPDKIETLYDVGKVAEYYGCKEHELTVNGTKWNFKFSDPSGPYKDKMRDFIKNNSPQGTEINVEFGLVE